ncbi:MAG TPA: universal stress protein [Streptosporangiaceae bacterium]|nr:universal stress protein [Streptosporangiaceae bacterium]
MGKPAHHARRQPARFRAHAGFIAASAAFAAVFVALVLSAFHAPAPHDLPVGIVAPAAVTGRVEHALGAAVQGGFELRPYPSQASATAAIGRREVDGALIAAGGHLRLLVAQAGGSGPAQALTQVASALAARSGQSLTVTDVVPPLPRDSDALSPFFVLLGVLVPSLAAGSASAMAFRRARPAWCVAAPAAAAVVIGAISAGIADGVAGLGHYPAIAGVVALFSLAVSAPTAALGRIWPPLTAAAILVFLVLGIPVSGGPANLAPFGPGFLRPLDPALPLGAAAGAVRNAVYFGGHGTAAGLWVLAAWAAAGVAGLALTAGLRRRAAARPSPAHAPVPGLAAGPARVSLVVGFDNSEPARRALRWAAGLLAARPGDLHVIYADHAVIDSDLSGFAAAEMETARDHEAAGIAEAAAEIVAGTTAGYAFERRQGPPADAILSGAGSIAAAAPAAGPVIVVGRSGQARHHVIGSVPAGLLHHSPYPVLAIP